MKKNQKTILVILLIAMVVAVAALFFLKPKKFDAGQPYAEPEPGDNTPPEKPVIYLPPAKMPVGSFPLKKGSRGKLVQMIQVIAGVKPDGVWGNGTDTAVRNKLKTSSIDEIKFFVLVSANSGPGDFPLEKGSRGNYVKALQIMFGKPIDGIFGRETEATILASIKQSKVTKDDFVALVKYMLQNG